MNGTFGCDDFVNILEQVPGVQGGVFVHRMTPVFRICKHCTCDRSPHFLLKKSFQLLSRKTAVFLLWVGFNWFCALARVLCLG